MSLPVKLASFAFFVSFLTLSCKKNNHVSLERQVLGDNAAGVFDTTLTVDVSTVKLDLLPITKKESYYLTVGDYVDANGIGTTPINIVSKSFAQLSFSGFQSYKIDSLATVELELNYNYYLGDIADKKLTVNVYPLTEPLVANGKYNSSSEVAYDTTKLLARFDFKYTSGNRKATAAGSPVFKEILRNLNNTTEAAFKSNFYGIALVPSSPKTFLVGFKTNNTDPGFSVNIKNAVDDTSKYRLTISKPVYFSNAIMDPFVIPLGKSSIAQNRAYANEKLGIGALLKLPGFDNFLKEIKGKYTLLDAYLEIPSYDNFQQEVDKPIPYSYLIYSTMEGQPVKATDSTYFRLQNEYIYPNHNIRTNLNLPINPQRDKYNSNIGKTTISIGHYLKEVESGTRFNTPWILSTFGAAEVAEGLFTESNAPLSYSFWDSSKPNGIKLIIYYSKVGTQF